MTINRLRSILKFRYLKIYRIYIMKNRNKTFTLIELLVVVIIIAVLAALAVPAFNNAMENSREREARSVLQLIYNAEKVYKVDKKVYADSFDHLESYIEDPSTGAYYNFTLNSTDTASNFTATATRNTGSNPTVITIDQTGTMTPP